MAASEFATVVLVQLYRYRRVSTPRERQQTKWVIFGLAVPIAVNVIVTVLYLIFPVVALSGSLSSLAYNVFGACWPLFIPLSFGFAMLRSRLWDIDVLINRTLVYGALTVSLAAVYVGLVIGLSALLRGLISQDNGVAIILSTLAIAALFQPMRSRIQRLIDRRFYRRKYDAARTLAAFSATLRNQSSRRRCSPHTSPCGCAPTNTQGTQTLTGCATRLCAASAAERECTERYQGCWKTLCIPD
jgi:hypothetical protein